MERSGQYSIYPNQRARVFYHVLFWLITYFMILFLTKSLFYVNMFEAPNIVYSFFILITMILVHYSVCQVFSHYLTNKKYIAFAIQILLIYYAANLSTIYLLKLTSYLFPTYDVVKRQSVTYSINSIRDLFTERTFLWNFTILIPFNSTTILLKQVISYYESSVDNQSLLQQRNQMELSFLRSQIQPHFLFNTLNNIYGLVIDNEQASQSILRLSDLLRFSLYESSRRDISLKEEIKFLTDYIHLEKIRHKESRVKIECDFSAISDENKTIKPLLLVNFIENAFKHGINAIRENAWVKISLTESDNLLVFKTENNKPDKKKSPTVKKQTGLGLNNVRRRLELEYPENHTLIIQETEGIYSAELTLKIPVK